MTGLDSRRRMVVLAICCMSLLIVGLDVTIVNLALPTIRQDLHASVSQLQWTIDAYTLVLASLLMLAGATGDRLGRRRVFQTGLAMFTLGSLLCSIAPGIGWLIAFRTVQAAGGSMLNPVAMSIITNTFTEPRDRARAIGVWGAVVGLSMALGPIVGGLLVDSIGWRAIFWINVPVGVAAFVLAALFVPESRAQRPRRVDPVGQTLLVVVLAAITYGIIEGPGAGWTSWPIAGCFALGAIGLVIFVRYEARHPEPMIDTQFFRSAPFSGATVTAVVGFAAFGGFLFVNSVYLQSTRGLSPVQAGLYTLPIAAMTLVCSPLAGRLVAGIGPRLPLVLAGCGITASGLLMTGLRADSPPAYLITTYILFGLGFGMLNAPITNAAVSGMPRERAGVAAAVASTSRQIGQTLGVAVLGSVVMARVVGPFGPGIPAASHVGWWITAVLGVVVVALGLLTTSRWARGTAADTAARIAGHTEPAPVPAR